MDISKHIDKRISSTERWLKRQYKTALDETRSRLALIYEKYSKDGKLSYADMAKYGRLDSLEKELSDIFGKTERRVGESLKKLPADVYKESFLVQSYNIEQMADTTANWGVIPKDAIRAASYNPLDLIAKNALSQSMRGKLRSVVTQGVIQGKSYADMARDIKEAYGSTASKALTIARTEGQRAMAEGQKASTDKAQKLGIKVRVFWDAYLDDRTRDGHAQMNGVEAEEHDGELMFLYKPTGQWVTGPMDPSLPASETINCRCARRTELADEPVGDGQQMSYEEWKVKHKG